MLNEDSNSATLDVPQLPEFDTTDSGVSCCPKCASPVGGFDVCRVCGFYEKLGTFVDIDHEMEGFEVEKEPEPVRVPRWMMPVVAINLAILAESISVALLLPVNTYERLGWSILHMLVGLVVLGLAHSKATIWGMMDDVSLSILDCLTWPPKAWGPVIRRLPETSRCTSMALVGLMCILMSLLVIRAIPYGAIFEVDTEEQDYHSVIAEAVKNAKEAEPDPEESLEDAIEEFADQGDEDSDDTHLGDEADSADEELISATITARCIVVGFSATEDSPPQLASIVVATANRDRSSSEKFEILGSIPITDPEVATKLQHQLASSIREKPFIPSELNVHWVKPRIRCEVTFEEQGEEKTPVNLTLTQFFN